MSDLSELGRAALWYVENGFAVFPCVERGKRPAVAHGLNDWTDNPATVRDWWTAHPNDNIGLVCGTPSHGLFVLDMDEHDGTSGMESLSAWERVNGELPETATAVTGSGGMHYLYRTGQRVSPSTNADLAVDVRGEGSYIVAPPSVHPSGRRYEWQDAPDEVGVTTATDGVMDFVSHVQRNGGHADDAAPKAKFRLPDVVRSGERDNTLYRYACHLRSIGRSDEEILNAVAGANYTRCNPPMERADIQRIVRSACRHEQGGGVGGGDGGKAPGRPGGGSGGSAPWRGPRGGISTSKLGREIIDKHHARFIDGAPAVWTGRKWDFGKRAITKMARTLEDDAKNQDCNEVYGYVHDLAPRCTSDGAFDGRYYVQFANATYDVLSGEVVEPTPEMYVCGTLDVDLDLGAPYGFADDFLAQVSASDQEVEQALREVLGACMCSRRAVSQSAMLIGRAGGAAGRASNGKSTYLNWARSILGSGNVTSMDLSTLGQRFQSGNIVGKLANIGDDIPDGFLRGEELSMFKKVVTGDSIYTDVKNGEGFEFRPTATQVFSMNAMPRLQDTTEGVFRRLYFVPFRARFAPGMPGYDPDVLKRLCADEVKRRGAVLGLMGLRDLIERGEFVRIPDMAAEVEEVRQDNDSVLRWMADREIDALGLEGRVVADVYRDYRRWCDDAGERNPCSRRAWVTRLADASESETERGPHATYGKRLTTDPKWSDAHGKNVRKFVLS